MSIINFMGQEDPLTGNGPIDSVNRPLWTRMRGLSRHSSKSDGGWCGGPGEKNPRLPIIKSFRVIMLYDKLCRVNFIEVV